MLQLSDLQVSYGTTHAVRGVDLDVATGESLALLGANGAGKTSLLRAVSQLIPYSGSITFDGEDLRGLRVEQVALRGLLHVPEGRHVFADLTVEENLRIGMTARRGAGATFELDDVFDLFPPLVPLRDRLGFALSGGEQQMVALGRALVGGPRLLLIDEPSLGLAPLVADAVAEALVQIRGRTTLVVVEQNAHLALRVCTAAVVLAHGQILLRAAADELHQRDDLLATYFGQQSTDIEPEPAGPIPPNPGAPIR